MLTPLNARPAFARAAALAARLFVGRNTVTSHAKAIFGKLDVSSRAAAARLAADHGLA